MFTKTVVVRPCANNGSETGSVRETLGRTRNCWMDRVSQNEVPQWMTEDWESEGALDMIKGKYRIVRFGK